MQAVTNLAAVYEKSEEVVNLMVYEDRKVDEACMAVDMAFQAMNEAVRSMIKAMTRHRNVALASDNAESDMNRGPRYMWSGERLLKIQATSRPDYLWPEIWIGMSKAAKKKQKQELAVEKPKLDNYRKLRGIFF